VYFGPTYLLTRLKWASPKTPSRKMGRPNSRYNITSESQTNNTLKSLCQDGLFFFGVILRAFWANSSVRQKELLKSLVFSRRLLLRLSKKSSKKISKELLSLGFQIRRRTKRSKSISFRSSKAPNSLLKKMYLGTILRLVKKNSQILLQHITQTPNTFWS
jgi:hypothetical protein